MDYREQANLMQRDAEEFDGPGYIIGDLRQGAKSITDLLARAEAAEARAEKAEGERDAAVADLIMAEEAAEETNALLDDEVHPAVDYSLYLSVHDSVNDIVNWKNDDVWRGREDKIEVKCFDESSKLTEKQWEFIKKRFLEGGKE